MQFGHPLLLLIPPLLAIAFRVWTHAKEDGSPRISIWDGAKDVLKGVAIYTLFGPPLGFVPTMLVLLVVNGELRNMGLLILATMFSFVLGAVPAIATGAVVGALKPWLWGWRALGFSSTVGATLSLMWAVALGLSEDLTVALLFGVFGAVGGLLCARMWIWRPADARKPEAPKLQGFRVAPP